MLAIDTATPQVSVALRAVDVGRPAGDDESLATITVGGGRRHGELLAPAIESVCRLAAIPLRTVGAIAVDVGPGLFTGLRVGVATGQALMSALDLPGVGVTSLEVLAGACRGDRRDVVAIVDARRSEVFWARFRPAARGLQWVEPPAVARPEDLAVTLAHGEPSGADPPGRSGLLIVGDGAMRYRDMFATIPGAEIASADDAFPRAEVGARLAAERLPAGAGGQRLEPLYLRAPDVRIGWASRAPVATGADDG